MNERSLLLRTDTERQQFQGAADDVGRIAMPDASRRRSCGAAASLAAGDGIDLGSARARQRTNAMMESDRTASECIPLSTL